MMCCKCQEYEWRDSPPLKVVYKDSFTSKGYCLFHAPVEHKVDKNGAPIRVADFNAQFFAKVIEEHSKGQDPVCVLPGIIFPGPVNFSTSPLGHHLKPLALQNSIFKGTADFRGLTIQDITLAESIFEEGANFSGARFERAPTFFHVLFFKRTHFTNAIFKNGGLFTASEFGDATWFTEATFDGDMIFHSVKTGSNALRMHKLTEISLSNLLFSSLEANCFSFKECHNWPENFGFESNEITSVKALEELYRSMKQKSAEEHDQRMVSHWHYREKLMYKKQSWYRRWLPVTLTWWYWATSGFGERAVRAGVWLLALILSVFALMGTVDMGDTALPATQIGFPERLYAGLQHLLFITTPQHTPAEPLWRSALLVLTRVLVPVQFTLFALAVRNRFRR